jgi:hypothetical protein
MYLLEEIDQEGRWFSQVWTRLEKERLQVLSTYSQFLSFTKSRVQHGIYIPAVYGFLQQRSHNVFLSTIQVTKEQIIKIQQVGCVRKGVNEPQCSQVCGVRELIFEIEYSQES